MKKISMDISLEGVDAVLAELDYIEEEYRRGAEKVLKRAGQLLQGLIIKKVQENVYDVPRKGEDSVDGKELTGDLKQRWTTFVQRKVLDEYAIHVGSPMHYAPHLEYGTKGPDGKQWIFPRKFVEEAWLENREIILQYISNGLREVMGK